MKQAGRNSPCPCGSGGKYKQCCERARRTGPTAAAMVLGIVVVLGIVATVVGLRRAPRADAGRRVWSAEHGHWHTEGAGEAAAPGVPGAPQPAGPVPPGKVWSTEHGHWHDAG